MNVQQTITVHQIRIEGITNSSVFQIGAAGLIKSLSNSYNTGGFTGPAPEAKPPAFAAPFVPFSAESYPTRSA